MYLLNIIQRENILESYTGMFVSMLYVIASHFIIQLFIFFDIHRTLFKCEYSSFIHAYLFMHIHL